MIHQYIYTSHSLPNNFLVNSIRQLIAPPPHMGREEGCSLLPHPLSLLHGGSSPPGTLLLRIGRVPKTQPGLRSGNPGSPSRLCRRSPSPRQLLEPGLHGTDLADDGAVVQPVHLGHLPSVFPRKEPCPSVHRLVHTIPGVPGRSSSTNFKFS